MKSKLFCILQIPSYLVKFLHTFKFFMYLNKIFSSNKDGYKVYKFLWTIFVLLYVLPTCPRINVIIEPKIVSYSGYILKQKYNLFSIELFSKLL